MKPNLGIFALVGMLLALVATARAHAPDQAPHQIADLGEFQFEGGGAIKNLRMSYVTHGKLNSAKNNAILFQHGFAANHQLFDHMIGPGRPLDTDNTSSFARMHWARHKPPLSIRRVRPIADSR